MTKCVFYGIEFRLVPEYIAERVNRNVRLSRLKFFKKQCAFLFIRYVTVGLVRRLQPSLFTHGYNRRNPYSWLFALTTVPFQTHSFSVPLTPNQRSFRPRLSSFSAFDKHERFIVYACVSNWKK